MSKLSARLTRQALIAVAAVSGAALMSITPAVASPAPQAAIPQNVGTVVQPPENGIVGSFSSERIYDSRAAGGHFLPREARQICVTTPSVPADADAIVVNVTAVAQGSGGYLTLYPAGTTRPATSNLNYRNDRITPNLAVVKLSAGHCISVYNGGGSYVDVILDVQGYLTGGTATAPGTVTNLATAQRLLDTRERGYPVPANGTVDVQITGAGGIPASGVDAVILNVTVTQTDTTGWLRAWPSGEPEPTSSSMNYVARDTRAALVVSAVGSTGKVRIRNGSTGSAEVIVDAFAYTRSGDAAQTLAALQLQSPTRAWDTRYSGSREPLGSGDTLTLSESQLGLPSGGASAAIVTVTATRAVSTGYLQAYTGSTPPSTSIINYRPGQSVANLVVVRESGGITIKNSYTGNVDVIVDVIGWVTAERGAKGVITSSSSGDPLYRAPVVTYRPSYTGGLTSSLTTASDGSYRYTQGISTSSFKICAGSPETVGGSGTYDYVPNCYGSYSSPTMTTAPPMGSWVTGVDIALDPAATIAGVGYDAHGTISGGTVYATRISDGWTFHDGLDGSGAYLVRGLPAGSYRLKLLSPSGGGTHPFGMASEWYDGVGISQGGDSEAVLTRAGAQIIEVSTGAAVTGKNFGIDGNGHYAGVVTNSLEHGVSAYLTIYRSTGDVMATTTSATNGTWSADLHPGTYTICASATSGSTQYCYNGNVSPGSATPVVLGSDDPDTFVDIQLP
jgi:hypothetical protein